MLNCLRDAGLKPTDVDGVNMHGTSTPLGDLAESKAITHVFGEHAIK
jgi:3-oxoacyl-[acyl-carrier-protein] synthase II